MICKQQELEKNQRIWGIRAGKNGEAHDLFLRSGIVAIADAQLGDLTKLVKTREKFYEAYRKNHPAETKTGITGVGGKFFRFVHEMLINDFVIYPALSNKIIYVGIVNSEYFFNFNHPFPHRRIVNWKFMIPKNDFSISAKYELGAARTFFEFKKNAKELLTKIKSNSVALFQHNLEANKE